MHLFLMAGAALILLLVGVNLFRQPPGITVSGTVVLGTSLLVAFFPARRLLQLGGTLPQSERSAAAVFAYLDREPSVVEATGAKPLPRIRERIALQDVSLVDRQGRKILDGEKIISPEKDGQGVDVYVSTSSAGGGLQMTAATVARIGY